MNKRIEYANYLFYALAVGVILTQFSWMAYNMIGLIYEGSSWFFQILTAPDLNGKLNGLRWSDYLWQLPAYLSAKYMTWVPFQANLAILNYTYTLHPLIGVLLCWPIVKNEKHAFLYMTFPIFSLGTAVACNLAFVVGIANGAITFFWPLFFMVCFKDINQLKHLLLSLLLLALLTFNYEPIILFLPIIIFVIIKKAEFKYSKSVLVLVSAAVSSAILQVIRINIDFFNIQQYRNAYWHALLNPDYSKFYFFLIAASFILLTGILIYQKTSKKFVLFAGFILCLVCALLWIPRQNLVSLMETRENRAIAIPLAALIACSMAFVRCYVKQEYFRILLQYILGISTVSFLVTGYYLSRNIKDWDAQMKSMSSIMENETGCIYSPDFAFSNSVAMASLLIQKTIAPNALIITGDANCNDELIKYPNPCENYMANDVYFSQCRILLIKPSLMQLNKTKMQTKIKEGYKLWY